MIGETVTHYTILEKLGEGGMGIVYKAQDNKLSRLVALKFLPEHLSASEQDKARFLQEAQAAASLNHPNICTIYGIDEHEGRLFIAMELIDGESLREKKHPFTIRQTLDIGTQIAEGLAAAHDKGIVHRDIKPENIMVRKDGIVQIMDFGLAKLRGASRLTKQGTTVGTVGYMSPEQVQGQDTDHRTDIFSLGVILYEMLSGESPFKGVHETAVIYEIVNVDAAPISSVKPEIGPELDEIVLECLAKEPDDRYQSAREIAKELRHLKRTSSRSRVNTSTASLPSAALPAAGDLRIPGFLRDIRFWMAASGVALIGCAVLLLLPVLHSSPRPHALRAFLPPADKEQFFMYGNFGGAAAISPDGRRLAYTATDSTGKKHLCARDLATGVVHRLENTGEALFPFWSPDSRFIGFGSYGKLRVIDAEGGSPITLCTAPNFRGGAWSPGGTIIFCPTSGGSGLSAIPAVGGTASRLTTLDTVRRENSHRWPSFLPDGKHFLYFARSVTTGARSGGDVVCIGSLDGGTPKVLLHASSNAVLAGGLLLYARGTSLVAQSFNESAMEVRGEPITVADEIAFDLSTSRGLFTVSLDGILIYQTGKVQLGDQLSRIDRNGRRLSTINDLVEYTGIRLSPDGQRAASFIYDFQSHNNNVWITDLARGLRTRLTFGAFWEMYPVWSPDGRSILYSGNPGQHRDLFVRSSSGAGSEDLVLRDNRNKTPLDWSPNGATLLYSDSVGLWAIPSAANGDGSRRQPELFLAFESTDHDARFSPDGRWVAYMSDESGQYEVYIRAFPGPGGKRQVSIAGGGLPRWRRDGKELFYVSSENILMSVDISLRESTADVNNVHSLFELPSMVYDCSADSKWFLVASPYESQNQTPLTVVANWNAGLLFTRNAP